MRLPALLLALAFALAAPGGLHAQPPRRPGSRPSRPVASTPPVTMIVNGGALMARRRITQAFGVSINAEEASIDSSLSAGASPFVEGGLRIAVTPTITVGAVAFYASGRASGTVDADIPHPFYFDRPRSVSGEVAGLTRRQTGVHVEIGAPLVIATREIRVFGGPSFVRLEQALVSGVQYADAYPFDTAEYTAATTTSARGWGAGFNVGAETGWPLARRANIALALRYSHVNVELAASPDDATRMPGGGLQAGAGLRLRF